MKGFNGFLALPASLIIALLRPTSVHSLSWPDHLQAHEKYFPEHEDILKRNWELQQKMGKYAPAGVKKMSEDHGEKFFLEYWDFGVPALNIPPVPDDTPPLRYHPDVLSEGESEWNSTVLHAPLPPMLLHSYNDKDMSLSSWLLGRSIFERAFQCPSGTTSCTSIDQPNSCCQTGETCINVQDTGLGPVGCCPAGQTCGGAVSSCDSTQGYTGCPGSSNGGCCIPGYACQGVGCVLVGTATTVTTLPAVTVTSGSTEISNVPGSLDSTTTATVVVSAASAPTSPSVVTITTTVVVIPSSSAQPTTVVQTTTITSSSSAASTTMIVQGGLTCTTGYQSCPGSLGGGCCPTDRACGSPTCPPLSSSSSEVAPAIRPTSVSSDQSTITSTPVLSTSSASSTSTAAVSGCPTGFYMCSAYYLGGCCRVDRNCDTYSCPSSESTSVITSNGLTIVAPAGASSASEYTSGAAGVITYTSTTTPGATATAAANDQDGCASGWSLCAASVGGGCCPSGFVCGPSCTATISGESNVGKEAPSSDATRPAIAGWSFLALGSIAGVAMVAL